VYPHAANRLSQNSTPNVPRSSLPRPQAIGRSGSSASSKSGTTIDQTTIDQTTIDQTTVDQTTVDRSQSSASQVQVAPRPAVSDSDSNEEEDERLDNLLATCFTSGMGIPKSRSEPVDLKSKSFSKLRRDKSSPNQNKESVKLRERSKSKSPRNSRIIPGVRIAELKLVSRSDQQKSGSSTPTKGATIATEVTTPTAVNIEVAPKPVEVNPEFELDEPSLKQADPEKTVEDDVTLMETLTESRVLELEANRVVETVVEHQKQQQQQRQQQQNHYRLNLAKRMIGSDDNSNSMSR
jgi:hypothetical protein